MPEEHPLQGLVALQFVLESELVILIEYFDQVQHLCRGLDAWKWWGLAVVDERRDAAVRVQPQEPLFLLHVGRDVDQCGAPFGAVGVGKLLEHDLRGLAVGRVLRDEVQALGLGDLRGGGGDVEVVGRHAGGCGWCSAEGPARGYDTRRSMSTTTRTS
jgi:hypothetical protein